MHMQTRTHKQRILELFRHKAVYTRREMIQASAGIYSTDVILLRALDEMELDGLLDIIRTNQATINRRGVMLQFRLTVNGLDTLVTISNTNNELPSPIKVKARKVKEREKEKQSCGQVMRACYMAGCYLKTKCNAFKGERWNKY